MRVKPICGKLVAMMLLQIARQQDICSYCSTACFKLNGLLATCSYKLVNNLLQVCKPTSCIAGFPDQLPCISIQTKEKVCTRIELNSPRICQGHNHGRHFFV